MYHKIDPIILFSRLIAIVLREQDMAQHFMYALTVFPTSLFKDNAMRKTQKSQLAKALTTGVEPVDCSARTVYMTNGGTLVHKTKGQRRKHARTWSCVSCVRAKYGPNGCIVFDCYENGLSTKDQEHLRRSRNRGAEAQ